MNSAGASASWLMVVCGLGAAASGADRVVPVTVQVDSEMAGYEGYRALDGNPETMWHTDCQFYETPPPHEIIIDLGDAYEMAGFAYLPRRGGGNGTIGRYECYVGDNPKGFGEPVVAGTFVHQSAENVVRFPAKQKGRYLRLRAVTEVADRPWTSIAELRPLVEGVTFRATSSVVVRLPGPFRVPPNELDVQFAVLKYDLGNTVHFARVAPETLRSEALIHRSDRDPADVVLRRTAALLADVRRLHAARSARPQQPTAAPRHCPANPAAELERFEAHLGRLRGETQKVDLGNQAARLALFKEVCRLRRAIALANPLLDFDQILFIKRHRAVYNHMCDQYYGITAQPGGGLYVLADAFGPEPKVRDVLADAVVQRGRLRGQKLTGGPSIPPPLSYDGVGNLQGPDHGGEAQLQGLVARPTLE